MCWHLGCFLRRLRREDPVLDQQDQVLTHRRPLLLTDNCVGQEKGGRFLLNHSSSLHNLLLALLVLVSAPRLCSSSAHSLAPRWPQVHIPTQKSQCVVSRTLSIIFFPHFRYCFLFSHLQVCFNMGQITLAKKLARQALRLLKRNFPWTWFGALFQTFLEKYWHSYSPNQPPNNPSEK